MSTREPQIIDAIPERMKPESDAQARAGAAKANAGANAQPLKSNGKMKRIAIIVLTLIYVLSPLDLLPEAFLGPIGWLDDLGVLAWAARQVFFKRNG
jgi:uncharacterized membrane protein YkvA (DUF1232 family)